MNYSKGITWFDDCRIPFVDEGDIPNDMDKTHLEQDRLLFGNKGLKPFLYQQDKQGRFTPNLLVSDDMLNDGIITGGKDFKIQNKKEQTIYGGGKGFISKEKRVIKQDKGTNSRYYDIDLWFNNLLNNYIY
jgi:hypothetical protein